MRYKQHRVPREYEIVVFGATGFTGGLTAEYLARSGPSDLRWAIAGRNQDKLDAVKARLIAIDPRCEAVGTIIASVDDDDSLRRMVARTHVLLTTVGPFIEYGEPVVAACVQEGTDYVDSTGEPFFVERVIVRYAAQAEAAGVRIVSTCGFDSIPADLGVFFTVQHLPEGEPIEIDGYLRGRAHFSGGTQRSAIELYVEPEDRVQLPPPEGSHGRRVRELPAKTERLPEQGGWVAPLPTIDASVVVRSAAVIDRYGPDFSFRNHIVHGPWIVAGGANALFGTMAFLGRRPALRSAVLALLKKPGTGPTEAQMDKSWFKLRFVARCAGQTVQTEVSGGDPGYRETSRMLGESALCLARDRDVLPPRVGVLTPAAAMGDPLLQRLQRAGLRFEKIA